MNFYGLFGKTLNHSISPEIHEMIYEKAGIQAAYKKFEIDEDDLSSAVKAMKILGIEGANVTIPYKKDFIPHLDSLSPLAKKLQAINTIKNTGKKMEGFNTDYDGIDLTFERNNWVVEGKEAYILGSGGAAQAVAHYLKDQKAKNVTLVSRSPKRKSNLMWEIIDYEKLAECKGDILVNTTPIGTYPEIDQTPVNEKIIQSFSILFDMTYNPPETLFLKIGKEYGKETANGLAMLIGQAIRSVEIWEDIHIPTETIDIILNDFQKDWIEFK